MTFGEPQQETVVMVPGLWMPGVSLAYVARPLRRAGYLVKYYSYPTVRLSLEENARRLQAYVKRLPADVVHLVGHSLGGVVIRAALYYAPPPQPGRVVSIASPHRGCQVAQAVARRPWGRAVLGRSIADLLPGLRLPPPGREFGLIGGRGGVGLGRLFAPLSEPNDGVLTLAEMDLPGARDSMMLDCSHSSALFSRAVGYQVCYFLRHGAFDRGHDADPYR